MPLLPAPLLSLALLGGCAPAYHPSALHPTLFDGPDQLSVSGQIAVSGLHLSAAYAPVDHLAFRARSTVRRQPWEDVYWLAGGGLEGFGARGPLRLALGLEVAGGRVDASDTYTALFASSARRYEAHGALLQVAVPATAGWEIRAVQLGITGRLVAHTLFNDLQWTGRTRGSLLGLDSAFFFRVGGAVKLDAQIGVSVLDGVGDVPVDYLPLIAGLGLVVDLERVRRRPRDSTLPGEGASDAPVDR
ncbi:MAG: hypothetical protein R3F61_27675 [Myxococcota bacterium]